MTKLLPVVFLAFATIIFAAVNLPGPMAFAAFLTAFAFIVQGFIRPVPRTAKENRK